MRIAFLGLGRMGRHMAANLAHAGFDVTVWNRSRAASEALAASEPVTVAASPAEAAVSAEVIITMLADEAALRAVCTGEDGVLAGLQQGGLVVDMGTTGPEGIRWLVDAVSAAGGVAVDAPVSGSTAAAESASLTIMVGSPAGAFRSVEQPLRAMGSRVYHLGGTGAGTVAKLAVNNVIYALGNAVSESLVLAERSGLDRETIYDVFANSAIAAPMIGYRRDAFLQPEDTPPAFALALAQKDLGLITTLAGDVDLPVTQADANHQLVSAAVAAGYADHDMADVAVYLRGMHRAPTS